jgi:hypothetical protein
LRRVVMALTKEQEEMAVKLLTERPAVMPRSRAIVNEDEKKAWYAKVTEYGNTQSINDADWARFCDLAGVAD